MCLACAMAEPRTVVRLDVSYESWADARGRYFAKKSVHQFAEDVKRSGLRKTLGALDLTVLGIGAIIGAGIFALPGVVAAKAGPGMALSMVIVGFACALAALCYAEFASMVPVAGSAYTYTYASLGEVVAWLVGWNLVLEYAVGNGTVAVAWSEHFERILGTSLGRDQHSFFDPLLHAPPEGVFNLPAALIVLAVMFILMRGIRESARATWYLVGVKLFVLLAIIGIGAFLIDPQNFDPFLPFGFAGVMTGGALAFFAFIGFDAVSTAAEETKNPGRDMPIGILASLAICTVLYVAAALVLTGMVDFRVFAGSGAAAGDAFNARNLGWIALPILLGGIAGITSVLLVFQIGMPRIFFSMARDGLLPRKFAEVHPTTRIPYWTTIFGSILVALFAGVTPIEAAASLTNIGTLFAFIVVCIGVVVLRRRAPDTPRPFRVPGGPVIPIVGVVALLALMISLPTVTWIRFVAWMGVGLLIYGFYGARNSRLRERREVVLVEKGGA